MTQPNPGPAPADPEPTQNPTAADPATGPAPTNQPAPTGSPVRGDRPPQPAAPSSNGEGDPDQLGDAGKRALAAEREARKVAEAAAKQQAEQLAALQKQLDGLKPAADVFAQLRQAVLPPEEKTDTEKLTERVEAAEKAAAEERTRRVQLEVIGDLKLGREWIEFLRGDTYDDMKAYAEKLLALMPKPEPAATAEPDTNQTTAGDPPDQPEPRKRAPAPRPDPSQGARGATPTRSTSLAAAVRAAMTSGG